MVPDKAELVVQNQVWDWDGSAMKNIQDLLSTATTVIPSMA